MSMRWWSEAGATSDPGSVPVRNARRLTATHGAQAAFPPRRRARSSRGPLSSRGTRRPPTVAGSGSLDAATIAAAEAARVHDATVTEVAVGGEERMVTLERRVPTLRVQRIGALVDLSTREATARVDRPSR